MVDDWAIPRCGSTEDIRWAADLSNKERPVKKLGSTKNPVIKAVTWAVGEIGEKLNFWGTAKELWALGKKHGMRFFIAAVLWELIEDGLFPYISWKMGVPELIPFFLIFHFEPVVYPAFFWFFRMYDRSRGREPWEPDRSAQSSYWRSTGKTLFYNLATSGWLGMILASFGYKNKVMLFYIPLMTAFGFIHERVWHDSNYGIDQNDGVERKRILSKTFTYALVSTTIMGSMFKAAFTNVPWHILFGCQTVALAMYLAFELVWAKSNWGIASVSKST